jgi:hypothetical protein
MMGFAPILRKDFELHRVEISDLEAAQVIDEAQEHWAVPVVCAYSLVRTWRLEMVAPWLQGVVTEFVPKPC